MTEIRRVTDHHAVRRDAAGHPTGGPDYALGAKLRLIAVHPGMRSPLAEVGLPGQPGTDGFTALSNLDGYWLLDQAEELLQAAATPPHPVVENSPLAATYNRMGGFISAMAHLPVLGVEVAAVLAVWQVESGGRLHVPGHLITRFENHCFFRHWGEDHPLPFDAHFRFGGRGAAPAGAAWEHHEFCEGPGAPWLPSHPGAAALQEDHERRALALATRLSSAPVAYACASFGGPQIMGFNHARVGYPDAVAMAQALDADERAHVLAFGDFLLHDGNHSLLRALRAHDWVSFAAGYNGANVDGYAKRLGAAYQTALHIVPAAVNA